MGTLSEEASEGKEEGHKTWWGDAPHPGLRGEEKRLMYRSQAHLL